MTRLGLDPSTRVVDGGRVLIGGSPLRILRLSEAGAAAVAAANGADVPERLARRLLDAGMAHPRPEPGAGPSVEDVAVVVPVRDRDIRPLLAAIGEIGEVVVVDDGSDPPLDLPAVRVLRHDVPLGPGQARETGWRATSRPVVAFVDSDCTPSAAWLHGLLPHLDDPRVVAVAPRVFCPAGVSALARYEARRSPLDLGADEGPVRPGTRVSYVPTAALVVRREALEAAGGFDPGLPVGEDVDLVWRLAGIGDVRYEPAVTVGHPPRPNLRAWVRQRVSYGSAAAPLARRHPGSLAPLRVSAWSAVAWVVAATGWPVPGLGVAGATTALLAPRLRALRHPWKEALRLAGRGHLLAGRQVADAVVRTWWPLALVAAVASRRARRAVLLAAVLPPLFEWATQRPPLDPLRWLALRLADDVAYGAGVWRGCARAQTLAPLVPDLRSWSGRSD